MITLMETFNSLNLINKETFLKDFSCSKSFLRSVHLRLFWLFCKSAAIRDAL